MSKVEKIDLSSIPQADGIRIGWCDDPSCGPHVILLGEHDEPIAQFVLRDDSLREFITTMQSAAYDMATRRRG